MLENGKYWASLKEKLQSHIESVVTSYWWQYAKCSKLQVLTAREGNMEKPQLNFFFRGDNFPCYPLVQSIIIVLYWMLHVIIKYIVYSNVWFQNNPGLINIWVCISNNKHMRINSEKLVDIFLEYHLLSNNITHCQVSLRARATNGKIGRVDLSENENCLVYI